MFIKTNLLQKLTEHARIQDIHGGPKHGSQHSQWYLFHTRGAHSIHSSFPFSLIFLQPHFSFTFSFYLTRVSARESWHDGDQQPSLARATLLNAAEDGLVGRPNTDAPPPPTDLPPPILSKIRQISATDSLARLAAGIGDLVLSSRWRSACGLGAVWGAAAGS